MSTNGGSGRRADRDALYRRTMDRAGELAAARRRRQRLLVTAPAIVLVLALSGGVVAAVVATNGAGQRHLGAGGRHGSTADSTVAPTSTSTSTSTTPRTTTPGTTLPPHNGRLMKGFDPVSFTAVSLDHWWVLGYTPCHAGHCFAIAETLNGGATFSKVSVPRGLAVGANGGVDGGVQIRFADSSDGFVIGSGLWATTDDGAVWTRQQVSGSVTAVEAANGKAFALACGPKHCSLLEESVGSGAWRAVALPRQLPDAAYLAVVGSRIVVTNGVSQNAPVAFQLSTDGGASFSTRRTPCYPGLGGRVFAAASAPSALWAACPTGMMATPFRSTDNGSTWAASGGRQQRAGFSNGLGIAPVSATTALVWPFESSGGLALTTDGGRSYSKVLDRGPQATVVWAGYSDAQRGYAIFSSGVYAGQLWMSSDGGRSWREVRFTG